MKFFRRNKNRGPATEVAEPQSVIRMNGSILIVDQDGFMRRSDRLLGTLPSRVRRIAP